MTTPTLTPPPPAATAAAALEARVIILETQLAATLPTLATKADLARLEGKMDVMNERQEGRANRLEEKIDAMDARHEARMDAMDARHEARANQLDEKMDAMDARHDAQVKQMKENTDAQMDALSNRLLIRFAIIAIGASALVAAAIKYLP